MHVFARKTKLKSIRSQTNRNSTAVRRTSSRDKTGREKRKVLCRVLWWKLETTSLDWTSMLRKRGVGWCSTRSSTLLDLTMTGCEFNPLYVVHSSVFVLLQACSTEIWLFLVVWMLMKVVVQRQDNTHRQNNVSHQEDFWGRQVYQRLQRLNIYPEDTWSGEVTVEGFQDAQYVSTPVQVPGNCT